VTSIEVPYSIAAALPTLSVMDITNDVSKSVAESGCREGIAYIHAVPCSSVVRIQERETGIFEDLELMFERLVPGGTPARELILSTLMGPRTEAVPVSEGCMRLGTYQRIMLFSLDADCRPEWSLTILG
jgi:thiamine phosphate synthase YjbQ (UPF0047 family)